MYANEGRWTELTVNPYLDEDPEMRSIPEGCRGFYVRCGGCAWGQKVIISDEMLEDGGMPGVMRFWGWTIDPLCCFYCTGKKTRPDDPLCAPYPVAEVP